MSVILVDSADQDRTFSVNNWHWHPIVEAIGRLGILPAATLKLFHDKVPGTSLTREEAAKTAAALKERVLPTLGADQRLLLDGAKTSAPDDGTMHYDDTAKNYSTDADTLARFIAFCESCAGFKAY
jgi:hypothetical protein